jgi:hypothetical protein
VLGAKAPVVPKMAQKNDAPSHLQQDPRVGSVVRIYLFLRKLNKFNALITKHPNPEQTKP